MNGVRVGERGQKVFFHTPDRIDPAPADCGICSVCAGPKFAGALDPVLAFRESGYRAEKSRERPPPPAGAAPTHL